MPATCQHTRAVALLAILLLAFGLRLASWGYNRFLEDEALYAYWGLQIASGADPLLDREPVDKPPLHPYTLAQSFRLFGLPAHPAGSGNTYESAARLPSLFASMAGIALVYALGRDLYGDATVGLLAALLLALSPFDILFASTAFTDPLMVAFVLGAMLAAARGRLGVAGLLAALSAATKQQGLLFLPLVVGAGLISPSVAKERRQREHSSAGQRFVHAISSAWHHPWLRFALGFALVAAGVIWWDLAREQRPGFLEQSLISYGGLGSAGDELLGERAISWLGLAGGFWGSPLTSGLLLAAIILWFAASLFGWWPAWSKVDWLLAGFTLCYLLLHWLVGFQVWDRYLLGLVPIVALLAARAFVAMGAAIESVEWRTAYALGLGLFLVLALAGPVWRAAHSDLPYGGDHGAYDGIDTFTSYMDSQAAPGSVLYHHWLGYHYRFYLYDAALRLHWYPDLDDLVRDATVYRREPRYIAFPSWRDRVPAAKALATAGISLVPVLESTRRDGTVSFRLFRLEGP